MEENYIGILMNRKLIDRGIYIFKPECLIEGSILNEDDMVTFIDKNGYEYLTFNDAEALNSDEETVVGYIISEIELLSQYENMDLQEARAEYYDAICSNTHIGFYVIDLDAIAVTTVDFRTIQDSINNAQIDPNSSNIEIPIADIGEEKYIAIEMEEYKRILKIQNYQEMKNELEKIYNYIQSQQQEQVSNGNEYVVKKEVTGQYILDLFNATYERLYEIDDIQEMKYIIKKIEDVYVELTLIVDEKIQDGYKMQEANDSLYRLVDSYDELLKLDKLDEIKFELQKIHKEQTPKMKKLAQKYDKEEIVKETEETKETEEKTEIRLDVKDMKAFFDKKIVGQDEAKKDVISAIFMNKLSDNPNDRNSCMLVGPTGSGKTLLAETVSEYFEMPIEIIDTTQLTIPGYVGANIEDFLARLLEKAKGDLKRAENGIVVFDELDKKGSEKNEDVSGKGVLNVLLPFLQGTTYDVKYNNRTVHFNTSKLTIFATGAFTDVAKGKQNNSTLDAYKSTKVGYNSILKETSSEDIKYEKLEIEDFVKYGNMPIEIMGRFSTIAQLTGHTKESLKAILTDSNISALLSEKNKLSKIGIDLSWTEGYIDAVAEKAIKLKTGGRSLKSTIEKSIKEARWYVIENIDEFKAIILTDKTVENNKDCELIDKNGNSINLLNFIDNEILEMSNNEKQKVKIGFN